MTVATATDLRPRVNSPEHFAARPRSTTPAHVIQSDAEAIEVAHRLAQGEAVSEIRDVRNDDTGMVATALATPAAAISRSSEVLLLHDLPQPYGPAQPQVDASAPPGADTAPAEPEPTP